MKNIEQWYRELDQDALTPDDQKKVQTFLENARQVYDVGLLGETFGTLPEQVDFGEFIFLPQKHLISFEENQQKLSVVESRLLGAFATHEDYICTHEELHLAGWDSPMQVREDLHKLTVHISRLRNRIISVNPNLTGKIIFKPIQTVGYQLNLHEPTPRTRQT